MFAILSDTTFKRVDLAVLRKSKLFYILCLVKKNKLTPNPSRLCSCLNTSTLHLTTEKSDAASNEREKLRRREAKLSRKDQLIYFSIYKDFLQVLIAVH